MRLLLLITLLLTFTQAEPRKALLIGNSKYTHIPNLDNPSKPINSLKKALEGLGFDVVVRYNLNSENLSAEVEKFADRLTTKSTGFFYYSGHGSQLKGVSYIIPTNVDTKKANKVRYHALSINEVLDNLKNAKNRVNMLFFDACRDVPTGTRGGTRGLGIPTNKPNGSLIVYSTEAGKVAQDNSIFISELTKVIQQPNKKIWEIGNSLSNSVATRTNDKQIPEMYSKRLPSGFMLLENSNSQATKPQATSSKYITTIGDYMWQDEPYTKAEEKAYNDSSDNKEHGKVLKWKNALKYCKNLSLGGYSDWRLPSKKELQNLYKQKSKLKNIMQSNISSSYRSSTTNASNTGDAWVVRFYNGNDFSNRKTTSYFVRCVRAGQ